jgi:hypothetical protein
VKRGKEGKICGTDDGDDNDGDDDDGENDDQKINSKSPNLLSAHPRAENAPEPIPHASWE